MNSRRRAAQFSAQIEEDETNGSGAGSNSSGVIATRPSASVTLATQPVGTVVSGGTARHHRSSDRQRNNSYLHNNSVATLEEGRGRENVEHEMRNDDDENEEEADRLSMDATSTNSDVVYSYPGVSETHDPFSFSTNASPQLVQVSGIFFGRI